MFKKFALLLIIIATSFGVKAQNMQLYPTKSGMIKYEFKGRTKGIEIVYFDDYGKLLSIKKTVFLISNENTTEQTTLSIFKNDSLFEANMQNNTVSVYSLDNNTTKSKFISTEMLQTLGYNKLGNEDIAGITCVIYSGKNGTLWIWDNIVLKSEMEIMEIIISSEATLVMTDIVIPQSKFEISKKYRIIN